MQDLEKQTWKYWEQKVIEPGTQNVTRTEFHISNVSGPFMALAICESEERAKFIVNSLNGLIARQAGLVPITDKT